MVEDEFGIRKVLFIVGVFLAFLGVVFHSRIAIVGAILAGWNHRYVVANRSNGGKVNMSRESYEQITKAVSIFTLVIKIFVIIAVFMMLVMTLKFQFELF